MELRCSFYITSSFFLDKTDHPKPRGLCKRLHVVPLVSHPRFCFVSFSASVLLCLFSRLSLLPSSALSLFVSSSAFLSCVFLRVVLRAIHRAGQVAFQGAVGPIRLLDAAILTSSSRGKAILHHCRADVPARCLAREALSAVILFPGWQISEQ